MVKLPAVVELDTHFIADNMQAELRRKYLESKIARDNESKNKQKLPGEKTNNNRKRGFRL